jgi:hypothetical protein
MYVLRPDRSDTDHLFCIRQNAKTMWESNGAIIRMFINFEKEARKVSCNRCH